jgi:hypothetical protein
VGGLVLSGMGIVFRPFLLILAAIAVPNLLRARRAHEASAVGSLRAYSTAMVNRATPCQNVGFPRSVGNLGPGNGDGQGLNSLIRFLLCQP